MAVDRKIATESIQPVWPHLSDVDFRSAWRNYDLPSDTLMIYFGGRSVPAFSDFVESDESETMYLRLDIHTNEVVGIQIEYFLMIVVPSRPELHALLDGARLNGLTLQELEDIAGLLGIDPRDQAEEASFERVLERLLSDLKAGRAPLPHVVEPDQRVLAKVQRAVGF
ncbi:MAG TPA: hypothetical protein VGR16_03150 [Thermomicrobiales bacterium]|nr:hypothetical protein [Thermomicrobiales bacterium]